MHGLLEWFRTSPNFMPHGMCYLWQPGTLWLNVVSDAVIAAAYYAIPFALYYLVRERRREIPFPGIVLMFSAFILLCGTTHLMEIWTVWHPDYRVAGSLKAVTGVVSGATMLALFKVMPTAMQLRSPSQLQVEVDSRTAELARINEALREQINARDLAEAQLRDRDRRKDEFLATLAHELRNPLAPIRHAVKLLGEAGLPHDKQQWGRDVIDRQAHRMALLLDDLLDVSRITQGRLNLKRERVNVGDLVRSAIDTVRPAIEDKNHTLTVNDECASIEIDADPLRLSEAISNLLTNSAKYTPRGGRIDLSVTKTAAHLVFTVRDSGIGFDPSETAGLFEMFSRAHTDIEGGEGGLGIGLSLVQGLVGLHGGSVRAESPGRGMGSTFTILLPIALILSDAAPVQPSETQSPPGRPLRILVVDDNRDAADSLGMILQLEGHEVHVAYAGEQALAAGREHRPDAVILDIGMPDMSGYDVARAARQESWGAGTKLIALSGWSQEKDKEAAQAAGFDQHLKKPVDTTVVLAALTGIKGVGA